MKGRLILENCALEAGYILIIITTFLSILGQFGDLVFSAIKRYFGKKDFSNLPVNVYSAPSSFSQKFFGVTESIFKGNTLNQYLPNSMNMSKTPLYLWE